MEGRLIEGHLIEVQLYVCNHGLVFKEGLLLE